MWSTRHLLLAGTAAFIIFCLSANVFSQEKSALKKCISGFPTTDDQGNPLKLKGSDKQNIYNHLSRVQTVDQIVPDSPALAALNATSQTAIRPTSGLTPTFGALFWRRR